MDTLEVQLVDALMLIGSAVSGCIDTLLEVQLVDALMHYWKCS